MFDMKVISIRQPWAWLIVAGLKDIENRDWRTHFRGQVLIHAGKYIPYENEVSEIEKEFNVTLPKEFEVGGIIGSAEIVDCVTAHESQWFFGRFGFVLRNAKPCDFFPCTGKLGFFNAPENFNECAPVNIPVRLEPELF